MHADELDLEDELVAGLIGSQFPQWAGLELAPLLPWGTWIHGDLMPGNLLIDNGRLSGVIDWSLLSVGDPACDLMVAWMFLDAAARERLRAELDVDARRDRRRSPPGGLGL